jgi:hypothetical protein
MGKRLIFVLSGPFTRLPFHVQVTEPPESAIAAKLPDLPWRGPARRPSGRRCLAFGGFAQGAAPVRRDEPT